MLRSVVGRALETRGVRWVLDRVTVVSRLGWFAALCGVITWIVGWRLGWHEFMIVTAAVLLAYCIALPFVFGKAVLFVDVKVEPQRVVVGERSAGQMLVTNGAGHRLLPLRMELVVGDGAAEFDIPSLAEAGTHEELFVLPTHRRAVIPVGPATSVRGDPLGILRRAVQWTTPIPLYVHPRTVALANLGAGLLRDLEGQTTNTITPSDLAFHALREYEPGDDRRHIHWLTTARVGRLVVRQFVETRRSHLAILVDGNPDAYADEDEFELAISIAGSVGKRMLADGQELTMIAAGDQFSCLTTPSMLDGLAGATIGGKGSGLMAQAEQIRRHASGVSVVMLVTGQRTSIADVRATSTRFDASVTTTAVRADTNGATGFRPVGSMQVLTVNDLDALPGLLWAVSEAS